MRLWRKIDLEEFIQRFDLIVLNILVLHVIVKTTVLLLASGKTFGAIFKIKKQKFIFPIICIIIFFLLMIVFTDYTKLIEFRTKIIIPYIKIIFEVFIPILIVIISFLRKNKISKENKQIDYNI
jgi:spore germination protein KB